MWSSWVLLCVVGCAVVVRVVYVDVLVCVVMSILCDRDGCCYVLLVVL